MDSTLIMIVCVAGAVAGGVFFLSRLMVGDKDGKLRKRLSSEAVAQEQALKAQNKENSVIPMLQKIGTAAAQPFMPKSREKQSSMRRDLGFAGIYNPSAAKVMTGAKVIFMGTGLALGYAGGAAAGNVMLG